MDSDNNFVGDDDHAKQEEPLDYRLRCATKRTDLPDDVIRLLADAYYEVVWGAKQCQALRDKNDSLLHTNVELEARNKNLKEGFEGGCHLCEVVAENSNRVRDSYNSAWAFNEELEKRNAELERERDEARRLLCLEWMEHGPVRLSKEQIAMRYGWDCFKENTND